MGWYMLAMIGIPASTYLAVGLVPWAVRKMDKWRGRNQASVVKPEQDLELELRSLVVEGKDCGVSFEDFPYYLSEKTKELLTSVAYVHLKQFSRHTQNLKAAGPCILLSGPSELYLQTLAKALAEKFEAKLLLLDLNDFSSKISAKYGSSLTSSKNWSFKKFSMNVVEGLRSVFQSFSVFLSNMSSKGCFMCSFCQSRLYKNTDPPKDTTSWSFDDELLFQSLYVVLNSLSKTSPTILYIRDVDKIISRLNTHNNIQKKLMSVQFQELYRLPVVVLGSRTSEQGSSNKKGKLVSPFNYNLQIMPPEEQTDLDCWASQLEKDKKIIQTRDHKSHIIEILANNYIHCNDLDSLDNEDIVALSDHIEEIAIMAISHHLMNTKNPSYCNDFLVISSESLSHGLNKLDKSKTEESKPSEKTKAFKKNFDDDDDDDSYEARIRKEIIKENDIEVTFGDIGALEETKKSLQELVMLPLRRPELFKGGLLKPCKGILLFGPPGTGKTMLAKAIAKESGANFINVSISTIDSKWFGESEKIVKALFSIAAKVAPAVIFVDEVDSLLGQRKSVGEHEANRKVKNEFMSHWDGLRTKIAERILVLGATNRPFDLDEAIIRRFERRIMVDLPCVNSRESILKTLLSKENVEGLDYKELAVMTGGYTGSDLKNLCTTAAYLPVRELLEQETREKDLEKKENSAETKKEVADVNEDKKCSGTGLKLRPLNMNDMQLAKKQVAASFSAEGSVMQELKQWNELYGEGGSRKLETLSYFF